MHLLNFCKRLLITGCLTLLSLTALATQNLDNERDADKIIAQLYRNLNRTPGLSMTTRLTVISNQFLGKPYLLGALGEGVNGYYDNSPLDLTDAFDCETYVDTVLALAIAADLDHFKHYINQIRYLDGHVSYINRNHFTCLDWNPNNQHQGFVKDITATIKNEHNQSIAQFAKALIDKPAWYNRKSINAIRLRSVHPVKQAQRLILLKQEGNHLTRAVATIPYIPLNVLFDRSGKINAYLLNQIPNASILEVIRPNWDLTQKIGTHLNVSHLGFVFWKKGVPFFREASSEQKQVIDVPLVDYLYQAQKSPSIKGINIQIVLPSSTHSH